MRRATSAVLAAALALQLTGCTIETAREPAPPPVIINAPAPDNGPIYLLVVLVGLVALIAAAGAVGFAAMWAAERAKRLTAEAGLAPIARLLPPEAAAALGHDPARLVALLEQQQRQHPAAPAAGTRLALEERPHDPA